MRSGGRDFYPRDRLSGTVEKDGSFAISTVYPGWYGFRLHNLPQGHYIVKADQEGRDLRSMDVRAGGGRVEVDLASDGPFLSGRALSNDREPRPVSEATVFLIPKGGIGVQIAQTDQAGAYSFPAGVEPGEYKLVAVADLAETQRWDVNQASRFLSRAAKLTLGPREQKTVDLKVIEGR